MGEQHPAEPKVVVELCSSDLTPRYLTEDQRLTFLKLVGTRYNPEKDIVRMSCEKFGSRAQNKRYLGDLIKTLIKEAKEGDSFADIPLDLRHYKPKRKLAFPESWNLTEERKQELKSRRVERSRRIWARWGRIDGNAVVLEAAQVLPSLNPALHPPPASSENRQRVPVPAARKGKW